MQDAYVVLPTRSGHSSAGGVAWEGPVLKKTKSQGPMGPDNGEVPVDAALMARICLYYFKEGQTQDAIAQRLKITRKRVNRILGEARESGFVQIAIASPIGPCSELESLLVATFG